MNYLEKVAIKHRDIETLIKLAQVRLERNQFLTNRRNQHADYMKDNEVFCFHREMYRSIEKMRLDNWNIRKSLLQHIDQFSKETA